MPTSVPPGRRRLSGLLVFGLVVGVSTAATFLMLSLQTRTAASATPKLPNLVVLPASELRIDAVHLQNPELPENESSNQRVACGGKRSEALGRKLLCFSMTSWNSGTGPVELRPEPGVGSLQKVNQRVFNTDNTFQDYEAGFMDYHPTHNHVHFNDYATYSLRQMPGLDEGRNGVKTTFCIIDTIKIDGHLTGAPLFANYTSCGNPQGQVIPQGLSVGWGDTYTYNLDGQSVDITGLPNGQYRLIIDVDPMNRIRESDNNDNNSSVCFEINGNTVTNVVTGAFCDTEVCDGLDNDGDDLVDEFFPDTDNDDIADCVDMDDDGDGYSDATELSMGKNPLVFCAAMRADVEGTAGPSGSVSILDLTVVAGAFGQSIPPAAVRLNQDADNVISIIDLTAVARQFGVAVTSCP